MTILGTCWSCGAAGPLGLFLADAQARRALAAALKLPPELAEAIVPYLALHGPQPRPDKDGVLVRRRLASDKLARLLDELHALVSAGTVTRKRDTRAAPLAAWVDGFAQVQRMRDAGTLDLPLDGHGLLCEIVYRRAGQAGAGRTAASADQPLHPSHQPVAAAAIDTRRGAVAELLAERARLRLCLERDADTAERRAELAAVEAALAAHGIDPAAALARPGRVAGMRALASLLPKTVDPDDSVR